jgi:hypothetical protein
MAGNGSLRLSWDNCDPVVVNKDWTTNIQYKLVMSIANADVENNGNRQWVIIGPNVEDSWRFDADGCNVGQLGVSYNALDKACLAFQGAQPLGLNQYRYDAASGTATLDISNTYDAFTPLLASRYTVWQATFDHAFSATGMQDPAVACGFAENPLCFWIDPTKWELLLVGGTKEGFDAPDNDWVTWQDAGNTLNCPVVQAQSSTWGKVKGLYR